MRPSEIVFIGVYWITARIFHGLGLLHLEINLYLNFVGAIMTDTELNALQKIVGVIIAPLNRPRKTKTIPKNGKSWRQSWAFV